MKRNYRKPTTEIVQVQQHEQLLQASGGFGASRTIYSRGRSDGGSVTDDDEIWGD
jgi:hypothetical protein